MARAKPVETGAFRKQFALTLWQSPTGWRWRLKANNGRTVAASTEGYRGKRGAVDNIWDATGVNVEPYAFHSGRKDRYHWTVSRYGHGAAAVHS